MEHMLLVPHLGKASAGDVCAGTAGGMTRASSFEIAGGLFACCLAEEGSLCPASDLLVHNLTHRFCLCTLRWPYKLPTPLEHAQWCAK